jgi:hypothetical protein
MPRKLNWKLMVFSVGVCIAGGAVGLFFGLLAQIPYRTNLVDPPTTSKLARYPGVPSLVLPAAAFGGGSGVLAGVLWCGVMICRVLPKPPPRGIVLPGVLWGLAVGVMSTCILHLALKMSVPPHVPSALGQGLGFGVPVGLAMGLICGTILKLLAPRQSDPSRT